jgi:hypothetical protein
MIDVVALLHFVGIAAVLIGLIGRLLAWQMHSAEMAAATVRLAIAGALMAAGSWVISLVRT